MRKLREERMYLIICSFLLSLFLSVASVKLSISSLKNKRTYFQKENETPSFLIIIKFHPNKIYFKQ